MPQKLRRRGTPAQRARSHVLTGGDASFSVRPQLQFMRRHPVRGAEIVCAARKAGQRHCSSTLDRRGIARYR